MLENGAINIDAEFLNYESISVSIDIFLISGAELPEFEKRWIAYLSGEGDDIEHPNNYLDYRKAAIDKKHAECLEISVGINTFTRFHGVSRILPRNQILAFINIWKVGDEPYLIVNENWFKENDKEIFSSFALIDAIGMRSLLKREGTLEEKTISLFKEKMNSLAEQNRNYFFFSYADSVIIKSSWSGEKNKYDLSYKPEELIAIIKKVICAFKEAFNLEAYSIVTQGADQTFRNTNIDVSEHNNHIFFNSLGAHFAELFEIESIVKANIKNGQHTPKSLYVSNAFLLSLNFQNYDIRENYRKLLVNFNSNQQITFESAYLPIEINEFVEKLKVKEYAV